MGNHSAQDAVAGFDRMLAEETVRRNPALNVSVAAAASGLIGGNFSDSPVTSPSVAGDMQRNRDNGIV